MPPPQPIDWYQELKTWQSGIAALIAVLGLILGALFNFHLNRRRDEILRSEETLTVSTALYGEIILMRERIALMASALSYRSQGGEIDNQFVKDYSPSDPVLYPALAPKIGLLSPDLALDITRFYDSFREAKDNLALLVRSETHPIRYHPVIVLRPAVNAIYDVRTALRKIERLARIPPAKDPDSGVAAAMVDLEDQRRQEE
jgi:hypothetical protein